MVSANFKEAGVPAKWPEDGGRRAHLGAPYGTCGVVCSTNISSSLGAEERRQLATSWLHAPSDASPKYQLVTLHLPNKLTTQTVCLTSINSSAL